MRIPTSEISFEYVRSAGPGGQNVNKVATAVQLKFDVLHTTALSDEQKKRLAKIAGKRVTREGVMVITARRFRTQEQNREDAIRRLYRMVSEAEKPPAARHRTQPTYAAREKRLKAKKMRGKIKQLRGERTEE